MKLAVTRKTITWSGVVMVLVAVLAINGGAWLLERALMAPVNAYIRDRTLAFLQEKSVEGLLITFPRLDLSLVRRQVLIHDLSIRYDNKDSTRYVRFQANVPRITLEGVDLGDVIWHRHLRLDVVRLSKPVVSRFRETADTGSKKTVASTEEERVNPDSLAAEIPAVDSVIYNLFAIWLPDDVRQARIDLLATDNATIVFTSRKGSKISATAPGCSMCRWWPPASSAKRTSRTCATRASRSSGPKYGGAGSAHSTKVGTSSARSQARIEASSTRKWLGRVRRGSLRQVQPPSTARRFRCTIRRAASRLICDTARRASTACSMSAMSFPGRPGLSARRAATA